MNNKKLMKKDYIVKLAGFIDHIDPITVYFVSNVSKALIIIVDFLASVLVLEITFCSFYFLFQLELLGLDLWGV